MLPRLLPFEVPIGGVEQRPCGLEGLIGRHDSPRIGRSPHGDRGNVCQLAAIARRRTDAVALLRHQCGDARHQVAQVVGEVAVIAADQPLVAEVTILSVWRFCQQVIPERVYTDIVGEVDRAHDVAGRLAHFLAAAQEVTADRPPRGQRQARAQQHRRPIDAVVAQDVLAEEMERRPSRGESLIVPAVFDRRQVIGERVEPDVRDVCRIPRQRDAPGETGATDAEIAEARANDADDLVAPERGQDRVRMRLVPLEQTVLISTQEEEVVLLFVVVDRPPMDATQPSRIELVVGVVLLARHTGTCPRRCLAGCRRCRNSAGAGSRHRDDGEARSCE